MEKAVNRLLIFSLLAAIAFGALTYKFRNADHDSLFEEAYELEHLEYIEVDVSRMLVMLIPYDEPNITIAYTNDRPLIFETGDNSLTITESSEFVVSLFAGDESRFSLYLYLPRESYREISVYTSSGKISVGRVDAQSITAGTESGDIFFEDSISRLNLSTISGKIDVDFELIVDGTEIDSRRGSVDLTVPEDSQFSVDFDTETGMCDCELSDTAPIGSYEYMFNGGGNRIGAYVEQGILTIKEK